VDREQKIRYYDDLLEENTRRVMNGLSPTQEYMRLDYLTEKLLAPEVGLIGGVDTEVEEVVDLLGAFQRLLGPKLLEVN
jgi:hypothetical protein